MVGGEKMTLKRKGIVLCTVCIVLSIAIGGCAPAFSPDKESAENQSETTVRWSPESDCGACHGGESDAANNAACLSSLHATIACGTCHTSEKLATIHERSSGEMPTELQSTVVGSEACLSCHEEQELIEATKESEALTDKNGKTVNPHDLPTSEDHEGVVCASCHSMHAETDGTALQDRASAKCIGCHHAEVYECGTCH